MAKLTINRLGAAVNAHQVQKEAYVKQQLDLIEDVIRQVSLKGSNSVSIGLDRIFKGCESLMELHMAATDIGNALDEAGFIHHLDEQANLIIEW